MEEDEDPVSTLVPVMHRGTVYTFCHSDTTLPLKWDVKIQTALSTPTANACAFSFGIDTSQLVSMGVLSTWDSGSGNDGKYTNTFLFSSIWGSSLVGTCQRI